MHPLVRQQQRMAQMCRYDVAALWGMWHVTLKCPGMLPFIIAPRWRHIQGVTTSLSTFAPEITRRRAPLPFSQSVTQADVSCHRISLLTGNICSHLCSHSSVARLCGLTSGSNPRWKCERTPTPILTLNRVVNYECIKSVRLLDI